MGGEQRDPEQSEAGNRHGGSDPLELRQRDVRNARDHDGEDSDAACGGCLDKRERCKRERDHVENEAAGLDAEAQKPPPLGEQRAERGDRPAK